MRSTSIAAIAFLAALALNPAAAAEPEPDAFSRASLLRQAGRSIFSDPALSASGKQSCATCHAPARRYNPPDATDIEPGGKGGDAFSFRAPPTLTYLNRIPPYSNHFHETDDEGDESIDNGPTGGLTWDGRVDGGANQAELPLLAENEMGNSKAGVAAAVHAAVYAPTLRRALGEHALDDDAKAFAATVRALGAFEEDYAEFNPYTSKYDAFLTGRAALSKQEARGLQAFNDEKKGNCAQCHISKRSLDGGAPAFSDYGLIALAVPRNTSIARNRDTAFYDLGACGPLRNDKANDPKFCGLFRTPTLRNVAMRLSFFHNGKFHDLRDVVDFYVTRDISPQRWYARNTDGSARLYDDLPSTYWDNINRDPPFADQKPGARPALSKHDIDDVVAFMRTLTDGYLPANPYREERAKKKANATAAVGPAKTQSEKSERLR